MSRSTLLLSALAACAATGGVPPVVRIHDIQGAGQRSPLAGRELRDVRGLVTAVGPHGFWMQDPDPDGDAATSEGLFVHLDPPRANGDPLQAGDEVAVDGIAGEYVPPNRSGQLPVTQLDRVALRLVARGRPLPPATRLGRGGRQPPTESLQAGLDFWESLEGMLVEVADPVACSPTSGLSELWVLADAGADATGRNARGGVTLRAADTNPERILLGPALARIARVDVGARLSQAGAPLVRGVLDYAFANFRLLPTAPVEAAGGGVLPETVRPAAADELSVACFNLENFSAGAAGSRLADLARLLVVNLAAPDLVTLEEMQDDSGPTKDGAVSSERNARAFIEAIAAAGGPAYRYADIAPADGADGGAPGANIRCGLLWREDRGLRLSAPPALVAPLEACWKDSRKPLAAELSWRGAPFTVIACHFTSKSGDDPLAGERQPPVRSSEPHRLAQARAVRAFADGILAGGGRLLVLGDLNDFGFSEPLRALTADGGLADLIARLPELERYTYVWQGNSQQLDHVLANAELAAHCIEARPVHVNCEFAAQASDHDPVLARFRWPGP